MMASSSSPANSPRSKLRQATYIDPQTGSRNKKRFTLHTYDGQNGSAEHDAGESSPLLPRVIQPSGARRRHGGSRSWRKCKDALINTWEFASSETGKGVLKCSLAYLLGSLATFVPALSTLFGKQDSKHLVATITVYFHPARSLGSMFDASILAFTAFIYTAFISVTSMSVSAFCGDTLHLMALGHAIVLIVFVGGGLGFVGWVKLKKGDPLVNIACSLTSLSLITILTKEGAVQAADYSFAKISQILKMIVAGVIATMLVSVLVFPISAKSKLKENMVDVTDSLADLLAFVTSSFLSGDENELEDAAFTGASGRHRKTFAKLGQSLKEAKYEHYFFGTERQYHVEAKLVHCVQRLTQSIGGLRSAAAMQFAIIKQPAPFPRAHHLRDLSSYGSMTTTPSWSTAQPNRVLSGEASTSVLASIAETPDEDSAEDGSLQARQPHGSSTYRSPSQIFELFIDHLGPSMRSLAYTLKEILDELPYDPDSNYAIKANPKFRSSLERALAMYREAREEALKAVYAKQYMDRARPTEVEADWEEAAASCGHFSFSLIEVAEQMKDYLIILDELQLEVEETPAGRTWSWLKFWISSQNRSRLTNIDPELIAIVDRADEMDLHMDLPLPREGNTSNYIVPEAKQSIIKQKLFRRIYKSLSFFRRDDTKFAIKVGIGAALYALPAFIPSTRPVYSHWRGEWGLLSYMLVCSMTIGASNTTGYSRFLGTCLGAVLAIAAWEVADENPFLLALFGFLMAYWTAYIIVGQGKGPMGRFIMLTYNLSALYAYSLAVSDEENDGDEEDQNRNPLIFSIVKHRVVAVLSGCVWGLIITRLVWPISARQKLKDGLSLIWLRMGIIWKRDPLAVFLDGHVPNEYMNLREEMELARFLGRLEAMVDAAKSEFELRGPFPSVSYGRILKSTARMLDAFHAMNVVILKDLHASQGEEKLLNATAKERGQLCARISHLFGVLASSMKLGYPISGDALPTTENARDRLLAKVFAFRKELAQRIGLGIDDGRSEEDEQDQAGLEKVVDEDFGLLYTYALVTGQLGMEIRSVLKEVEDLFGVLDEEVLRLQ